MAHLNRDETAMNSAEPELVTACTTLSCQVYASARSVIWPHRLHLPRIISVDGKIILIGIAMCHDFTRFSSMLGKIAALQKEVIAGFPGSSNKQEDFQREDMPAGLSFCPRPDNIAVHPEDHPLSHLA